MAKEAGPRAIQPDALHLETDVYLWSKALSDEDHLETSINKNRVFANISYRHLLLPSFLSSNIIPLI